MLARPAIYPIAQAAIALSLLPVCPPVAGQERIPIDLGSETAAQANTPPQVVDILVAPPEPDRPTAAQALECVEEAEASELSGDIVVCGKRVDNSDRLAGSYADWLKDYAERSKNFNAIPAPDVDNTDYRPPGVYASITITGCFIPPCPTDPALLIDVENLPPPPLGSDAYWLAQGQAPKGDEAELTPEARRMLEQELGLPPKPDFSREGEK